MKNVDCFVRLTAHAHLNHIKDLTGNDSQSASLFVFRRGDFMFRLVIAMPDDSRNDLEECQ